MMNLITNRERENVLYRNKLAAKGFSNMTVGEKAEWLGDPMQTEGANLFPPGPHYSSSVEITQMNGAFVASALTNGVYLYSILIIGNAEKFEGKTLTLSADNIYSTNGKPQIALWWHDDNGYEFAGASMTESGSITFTATGNTGNRAYLAAYVYVTTDVSVVAGDSARFSGVMLEVGATRHEYVPYAEIIATPATIGAYNYYDLNRVERAVAEVSAHLGLTLTTKTDWTMWDIPRVSDMNRYLNNIKAIKARLGSNIELPESMDEFTYSSANNIEKILLMAYESIRLPARCGEVYCGEV